MSGDDGRVSHHPPGVFNFSGTGIFQSDMRGGRGGRGRGGRGRGPEIRSTTMETRSGSNRQDARVEGKSVSASSTMESKATDLELTVNEAESDYSEEENGEDLRDELMSVKEQLEELRYLIQHSDSKMNTADPAIEEKTEEFPALCTSQPTDLRPTTQLHSWRDKVLNPKPSSGMQLKFIPPVIENGFQVVHIESSDVVELVKLWKLAVVVYVVGGNVTIDIIKGFIRKHWSVVDMPTIHLHEEGYFIMKFKSDDDCDEIIRGGPYFLNKAPMIVKKWTPNFDFKEEIVRVIPVWVRLPSLPLHCWGEDSLSRIVSAVGVPIIADECTTTQAKVSYARVLVEIDVTQDFVTDIRVKDNNGREFTQKAIPEWRPYFCRKCNKLGHMCSEGNEGKKKQKQRVVGEDRSKKVWLPKHLVNIVQTISNVDELRDKLGEQDLTTKNKPDLCDLDSTNGTQEQNVAQPVDTQSVEGAQTSSYLVAAPPGQNALSGEDEMNSSCMMQPEQNKALERSTHGIGRQTLVNEDGWSTVPPGKTAKRGIHSANSISVVHGIMEKTLVLDSNFETVDTEMGATNQRDGSPLTPSPK